MSPAPNRFHTQLAPLEGLAYTMLRVMGGLMFGFHGVQKVFGLLTDHPPAFGGQLWLGGVIELVTGALIAANVLTPYAAFLASGTMAVAYAQFHWKGAFDTRFFPALNKGELAAVYSLLFFFIACRSSAKRG